MTAVPPRSVAVDRYLDRLRDVLPTARAGDIVREVEALIEDRIEQDVAGPSSPGAADRALAALGSPEALASSLAGDAVVIDLASRRAFTRMLTVVFAAHLLVSIVLTVIAEGLSLVPGLLSALPRSPLAATFTAAIGVFLVDVGALLVLFRLLGMRRAPALLEGLRLRMPVRRQDAVLSLVLLALLAVIINVPGLRDHILAVGVGGDRAPVLVAEVIALTWAANAVLLLFAVRHVLLLVTGVERVDGVILDALASLAGAVLSVLVMTRDGLVRIPTSSGLTEAQATVFADLLFRVVFIVCLVASILLVMRFARRLLRVKQLLGR